MAIKNRCATCNHVLSVPDDFGDMTVRCPNCAGWMRIVEPGTTGSGRAQAVHQEAGANTKRGGRRYRRAPLLYVPTRQSKNTSLLRTLSITFLCTAYALGLLVPAIGVFYLHLTSKTASENNAIATLFFVLTLICAVVVFFIFKFLAAFATVLADIGEDQQAAIAIMRDICLRVEQDAGETGGKA